MSDKPLPTIIPSNVHIQGVLVVTPKPPANTLDRTRQEDSAIIMRSRRSG